MATFAEVENATLVDQPPPGEYTYELKYDGYRILACKWGSEVRLRSRRGQDWTSDFHEVATAVSTLAAHTLVLDGEMIAPDQRGVPSFQRLQNRQRPFTYVVFDLVCRDNIDLRGQSIEERRSALTELLGAPGPPFARATALPGKADELLRAACGAGFEGLMGKRVGSPYRPGRGLDWIKLKCERRQEFAVVGYLPLTGAQRGVVGSLLLALHENGRLIYAGKVGTGFDTKTRSQLGQMLEERHVDQPTAARAPGLGGLARWARPGPVVEVRLSEWTRDGYARHPSYLGLRPDKLPEDCVRESR